MANQRYLALLPYSYMWLYLPTSQYFQETAIFEAKLLHHEERYKSSPGNLPNFNKTLVSNIEPFNDTYAFKEATSHPNRLEFVEEMIKEIGSHEVDRHCTLVKIK